MLKWSGISWPAEEAFDMADDTSLLQADDWQARLAKLDAEYANQRAAMEWAVGSVERAALRVGDEISTPNAQRPTLSFVGVCLPAACVASALVSCARRKVI